MKVIRCNDAGFDCKHVIRAETEDDAMRMAAEHARKEHGVKHIDEAMSNKIKSIMREE